LHGFELTRRRHLADCDRGATAVEFALVSPIIIAILLAALQIGVVFLAKSYLETATEAAARLVLTNQTGAMTQSNFQTAVCNQIGALFNCSGIIVQLGTAPSSASQIAASLPQFTTAGVLTNPTGYGLAPAPAKMMLVVMYKWPLIVGPLGLYFASFSDGTLLMTSTQIFQIEPSNG
jgi:Flp pilus assembly protein TadG